MNTQPEALRLADALQQQAVWEGHYGPSYLRDLLPEAAAELRRLHAENETLRKLQLDAHQNTSVIFGALVQISLLTPLGGEVADYEDVVEAVRRLHAANAELLEALKLALSAHGTMLLSDPPQEAWKVYGVEQKARAAIAKAEEA